jgi:hypothetical protein
MYFLPYVVFTRLITTTAKHVFFFIDFPLLVAAEAGTSLQTLHRDKYIKKKKKKTFHELKTLLAIIYITTQHASSS